MTSYIKKHTENFGACFIFNVVKILATENRNKIRILLILLSRGGKWKLKQFILKCKYSEGAINFFKQTIQQP